MPAFTCRAVDKLGEPIVGLRVSLECVATSSDAFFGFTSTRGTVDCWLSSNDLSELPASVDSSSYSLARMSFHFGELYQDIFTSWPLVHVEMRVRYDCHQLITLKHSPHSYKVENTFIPVMDTLGAPCVGASPSSVMHISPESLVLQEDSIDTSPPGESTFLTRTPEGSPPPGISDDGIQWDAWMNFPTESFSRRTSEWTDTTDELQDFSEEESSHKSWEPPASGTKTTVATRRTITRGSRPGFLIVYLSLRERPMFIFDFISTLRTERPAKE
ncbi:hypothetical protein Micbo1qcDRAFT_181023 [Microdochium bolleyi]|uniref:Uncharacterized protein n=1 Tax=Microdochium bolleyi TaxID=196109 RepID=A0A136IKP6_9PEZI|nr:hypothetical protein Micbo1qcDRAFT_181023 [Microdochium bolleyi]